MPSNIKEAPVKEDTKAELLAWEIADQFLSVQPYLLSDYN